MSEGIIATILKGPGDSVSADEVIMQIETDKVTMDVRAPASGIVQSISVRLCRNRQRTQTPPSISTRSAGVAD